MRPTVQYLYPYSHQREMKTKLPTRQRQRLAHRASPSPPGDSQAPTHQFKIAGRLRRERGHPGSTAYVDLLCRVPGEGCRQRRHISPFFHLYLPRESPPPPEAATSLKLQAQADAVAAARACLGEPVLKAAQEADNGAESIPSSVSYHTTNAARRTRHCHPQ